MTATLTPDLTYCEMSRALGGEAQLRILVLLTRGPATLHEIDLHIEGLHIPNPLSALLDLYFRDFVTLCPFAGQFAYRLVPGWPGRLAKMAHARG